MVAALAMAVLDSWFTPVFQTEISYPLSNRLPWNFIHGNPRRYSLQYLLQHQIPTKLRTFPSASMLTSACQHYRYAHVSMMLLAFSSLYGTASQSRQRGFRLLFRKNAVHQHQLEINTNQLLLLLQFSNFTTVKLHITAIRWRQAIKTTAVGYKQTPETAYVPYVSKITIPTHLTRT